jgi:hypothetical protein
MPWTLLSDLNQFTLIELCELPEGKDHNLPGHNDPQDNCSGPKEKKEERRFGDQIETLQVQL